MPQQRTALTAIQPQRSPATPRPAWLSAALLFASWMPHAALHQHIGMRPTALLPVEWAFHGGATLAIATLLSALAGTATKRPAGATPSPAHIRGS